MTNVIYIEESAGL